jgi:hypothetical protein
MRLTRRGAGALAALLLLLATVAFGIGIGIEKAEEGEHSESAAIEQPQGDGTPAEAAAPEEGHEEEILGIEVESTPLVVTGVVVSLLLALALWRLPRRAVLALGALFCLAFAVLDGIEVSRKLGEETTIAILALAALVLHAGAAAAAAMGLRSHAAEPAG